MAHHNQTDFSCAAFVLPQEDILLLTHIGGIIPMVTDEVVKMLMAETVLLMRSDINSGKSTVALLLISLAVLIKCSIMRSRHISNMFAIKGRRDVVVKLGLVSFIVSSFSSKKTIVK
jgi:hypothetical protein